MSQFITKLRQERDEQGRTGRDGIEWPTPVGTWKQGESINRLETFADNLDVSQAPGDTDLLNSVPTPWARLLLFESALYKSKHPSHADIEDQWRGLLGVLALAEPLRLAMDIKAVTLGDYAGSKVVKTFSDLRPHYFVGNTDIENDKWHDFQTVRVDKTVLGATSPRTLVFTGVAHQCPASIPFRSPQGRLSDPVAYYKRFGDTFYLGLLSHWINSLITSLQQDQVLRDWLGEVPAAPGAAPMIRMSKLIDRLKAWQGELGDIQPVPVAGNLNSRFTLFPYSAIRGLPAVPTAGDSDLYLRGHRDVMVCYHPTRGSKLLNAFDQELVNEPLKVYDGRWIHANQPLPLPFNFLPKDIKVIEDPVELFEESLIQVNLPANPDAVYFLKVGDDKSSRTYLFPFKPEILRYFSPAEINEITKIVQNPQTNSLRVEFSIPLENNRVVRASREYEITTKVMFDVPTAELAAWPDFMSPTWTHYFYLKTKAAAREVDFEPIIQSQTRDLSKQKWYVTTEAAQAFAGRIDDKKGLLMLRHKPVNPPNKSWKVGIDFGSTHTLAFSLRVDKRGDNYVTGQGEEIQPIHFVTRARPLTFCERLDLRKNFFGVIGDMDPPQRNELKTLLMLPDQNPGNRSDWLPREGFVYLHWIYEGEYDKDRLRHDLKWNSHADDYNLRAFLRCLFIMIQAEAAKQEARVVSVSHSYPSAFTKALAAKHKAEWEDLEGFMNLGVGDDNSKVNLEKTALTETVAVCRHLECDQEASPVSNTISLDVGGSTTDMAVWTEKNLLIQESIKLAAGVVGRYLQSPDAREFLVWLENIAQKPPHNLKNFSLEPFVSKPSGYSLMFNNLLSYVDWRRNLPVLIEQIQGAAEARKLLAHIVFLFGGLLYYAGLLARRGGLSQKQDTYFVYFCGKGGQLIKWVLGYDILAQEMFEAGILGPSEHRAAGRPTVEIYISRYPKEEVGRGLLAESALKGDPRGRELGIANPNPPSVTVGETGYPGLEWNAELSGEVLKKLPENRVPAMTELSELNAFLEAFKEGQTTRTAAEILGLHTVTSRQFENRLLQRLFGAAKGCVISDLRKNDPDALIEPLFITELKVLLESLTSSMDLFS